MSKECSYEGAVKTVVVAKTDAWEETKTFVDPLELLTVIRDLDRRCAELEGQVAQLRRKPE